MRQVHQLIKRMSKSRYPALILGETGTGKEVVARAIHNMEGHGPFVVVDCSSLVGPLMESELFGYAKGASPEPTQPSLVCSMPPMAALPFLMKWATAPRSASEALAGSPGKRISSGWGVSQRSSSFRVIAATNRDLAAEVETKRFRQDLYYRLNVMRIRLTPLRERRDDIPAWSRTS